MYKKGFLFFLVAGVFLQASFGQNAGDFKTSLEVSGTDRSITITGYTGTSKDIVIPAVIGGIAVKTIGEHAFELKGLTGVVIPEGIECIAGKAFFGNKLARVEIPSSIKVISDSAFDSNLLISVKNGPTVTVNRIAQESGGSPGTYYAAANKTGRKSPIAGTPKPNIVAPMNNYMPIQVPRPSPASQPDPAPRVSNQQPQVVYPAKAPVINIQPVQTTQNETYIFNSNSTIQSPSSPAVSDNYAQYSTAAGTSAAEEIKQESRHIKNQSYRVGTNTEGMITITDYTGSDSAIGIPTNLGATAIGKLAFYKKSISAVAIPDQIVYIGDGAFMANSITSVIIPDSIRYIGRQAFTGNPVLSITIGSGVGVQRDAFRDKFYDYYEMAGFRAGTYIWKSGQWDLSGEERVNYNVNPNRR
ncbi:hypothetical protein FACS1894190_00760 [Spirochaetia bacterium]|nr:hypothetical protein FACS1894190_00760 [Spirochaetia bacterium]